MAGDRTEQGPGARRGKLTRLFALLYRLGAALLPPGFRRRYAGEMVEEALAELGEASGTGRAALVRVQARLAMDMTRTLIREWWSSAVALATPGRAGLAGGLRAAARGVRRAPGFAATVVLLLGLAIGATTSMYALVDGVLLRPLPYPDSDRLVAIRHDAPGLGIVDAGISDGLFDLYRQGARSVEGVAAYNENVVDLSESGDPERVAVAIVTSAFFDVLGASAAHGRLFTPDDAHADPARVVLSHSLWVRRYGADPAILGRTVELNRVPKLVVGVAAPEVALPRPDTDVWYVFEPDPEYLDVAGFYRSAIARLSPDVGAEGLAAELNVLLASLPDAFPEQGPELIEPGGLSASVVPLRSRIVGEARAGLLVLLASAGGVLLIAIVNLTGLHVVRATGRRRDVALRRALGADRRDLAGLHFGESLGLAALALLIGLIVAEVGVAALVRGVPSTVPRLHAVGLDGSALGFAAGLAFATALVFGLAQGAATRLSSLPDSLKEGSRGATGGRRSRRSSALIVGTQVAMTLTLLVGSALLLTSFRNLQRVDLGFDARDVLSFEISLPARPYAGFEASRGLWYDVVEGVGALPGVISVGAVTGVPLGDEARLAAFYRRPVAFDPAPAGATLPTVDFRYATPGYFATLGIPTVRGVLPGPQGSTEAAHPVVVSAPFAAAHLGHTDPVGARLSRVDADGQAAGWSDVVAVVGGVVEGSLRDAAAATLYIPLLNEPSNGWMAPHHMTVVARTDVPPLSLAESVRAVLREIDPKLPVAHMRPLQQIVDGASAEARFLLTLVFVAAIAALLLAAVGIYGVVSYDAAARSREIAIRMALGGRASAVRAGLVRSAVRTVLVGVACGMVAAVLGARSIRSLLFEVAPYDPLAFLTVTVLLTGVATVAALVPAARGTRRAPREVLASE